MQLGLYGGYRREERQGVLHRHLQDLLDVLPLEADFQGFSVIALALADVAGHVHISEKVHFHFDHAIALTRFATPTLDVEAEAAGFVAPRAGFRNTGVNFANGREETRVGRGIGSRRAADRALVDLYHAIDVVQSFDAIEMRAAGRSMIELGRNRSKQRVVDQRRFARTRHAGHTGHQSERKLGGDVLEVIGCRAADAQLALRVRGPAGTRYLNALSAAQVLAGNGIGMGDDFGWRALRDNGAAMNAGTGTQVHHMVGLPNRIFVMLDHDDRVAKIAQIDQRVEQPLIVALVQTDGGFIEDVHDADQPRPDLARQPDALRFAAGQRIGAAIQGEIAQSHIAQETETIADFLDDFDRDFTAPPRKLQGGEELNGALHRQR